ncbi:MAG: entericidin A/B family lipoprotein [Verrucomicrobiota bacterium JB022]|nr:entericidin A/B family lipoprotein [Verrucomicrobiota bacterium JB022]
MKLKNLLFFLGLISALYVVTGCNTTEGFGEDIESAGENLSDAARDAN